ncbi:MAG: DNA polymerase III subunit delta [Lachnospirales bacterium]
MKELDDEIKKGMPLNVYLLFGDETYLVNKYVEKIDSALIDNNGFGNNDVFSDPKVDPMDIYNAASTVSFSTAKRYIKVIDSGFFYSGRKAQSEEMKNLFGDLPECNIVFVEKKVDKKLSLYKYFKKNGKVFEFETLKEKDILKYALSFFKEKGNTINNNNLHYFLQLVDTSLLNIYGEVNKLSSYKINGEILKEDIDLVCTKSIASNVFDLVLALGNKEGDKAQEIYRNLLLQGVHPIAMIPLIARQMKLILICKDLLEKRNSKREIASKAKISPYFVDSYITQGKNFKKLFLYNMFKEIGELDYKIKTGQIKAEIAIEIIISKSIGSV